MTTPAKLSDKLYRWRKPNGGHDIGRIVERALCFVRYEVKQDGPVVLNIHPDRVLVRCEFGREYWVNASELVEHDTSYRQKEKEAGQ